MSNETRQANARCEDRQRQGTVIMLVVVAMVAMFGVAALATDVGHVWAARSELQAAADSAALAGAAKLVDPANQAVTLNLASAEATSFSSQNEADQNSVTIDAAIPGQNLTPGQWDFTNRTLDTSIDLTNYTKVDALRVVANLSETENAPVQTVLARVLGRDFFAVSATATGYLGWVGDIKKGTSELPIAIDCCTISPGGGCGNYCQHLVNNKPNPFTLPADPLADPTPGCADISADSCVTKLEFESTPEQNACYTDFGSASNVTTPELVDIVRSGNGEDYGPDGIQLDNGDKTPVVRLIKEKFVGIGEYAGQEPAGDSIYGTPPTPNNPQGADSWVVSLPVVACQGGDNCAGSDPAPVEGGVCLEIRRVESPPYDSPKEIFGRLFCPGPNEALDCGFVGAGQGGVPGGIRVERAVLVE